MIAEAPLAVEHIAGDHGGQIAEEIGDLRTGQPIFGERRIDYCIKSGDESADEAEADDLADHHAMAVAHGQSVEQW